MFELGGFSVFCVHYTDRVKRKGVFWVIATSKDPDQPADIYSLIRNSAILCYVPQYPMILLAHSEGPDQTAGMRRLILGFAVRIILKTRFHLTRSTCGCNISLSASAFTIKPVYNM